MEDNEDLDTDTKLAILSSVFVDTPTEDLLERLISCDGVLKNAIQAQSALNTTPLPASGSLGNNPEARQVKLQWHGAAEPLKRKNEPVLEIHRAEQIESVVPCALILNVLPGSLAKELLLDMLRESQTWSQGYFKLFDRTVTSPHVAGFYLRSEREIEEHRAYVYNGQSLGSIKPFTRFMNEAHQIVEEQTRAWLRKRERRSSVGVSPSWTANVAFSNLYDGRDSAVGYHSDQLTYLGPLPTIASLSLGCEREFRLKPTSKLGSARTISIRLPHNSLLIMGPGCQEDYKHSVHPVLRSKGLDIHPLAGARRINITYRNYRKEYVPENLPRCKCGQTVLRSAKSLDIEEHQSKNLEGSLWHGRRYFWHCDGDKNPAGTGCGFFQWAKLDVNGAPVP